MKKITSILATLLMVAALATPAAFACDGYNCGPSTATTDISGQAYDKDFDWDKSLNDFAMAKAEGTMYGEVETYANAAGSSLGIVDWGTGWFGIPYPIFGEVPNKAFTQSLLLLDVNSKAYALTYDFGQASFALGYSKVEGWGLGEGSAFGKEGCYEWVDGKLKFEGSVYQYNKAAEINYPGFQGIKAENVSFADGKAWENFDDNGRGGAIAADVLDATLKTKGVSFVEIDPYGDYRSMYGMTYNETEIYSNGREYADMYGNGAVYGQIIDGAAGVGGVAEFTYQGRGDSGYGCAELSGNIYNGGKTVSISASSKAVMD